MINPKKATLEEIRDHQLDLLDYIEEEFDKIHEKLDKILDKFQI